MANYRERLLTDSPTGPSFSTARRERSEDLSHIRETLNPGVPGHPDEHLSTPEGSGIFAARTPRLPRIHANRLVSSPEANYLPSVLSINQASETCQRFAGLGLADARGNARARRAAIHTTSGRTRSLDPAAPRTARRRR